MQITTTKQNLAAPLALVLGAADTRGTVPMLGTVLLKATDSGKLSMICSDTGMLARTLSPCEVTKGGEIAVDVRRLNDLIKAVPDKQPIQIGIEKKGVLLIQSGRSRFRLPTLPAADYPRMEQGKEDRMSVTMTAKRLAEMVMEVSPSMADADLRPYLNGALFSLDKAGLWIVSTDGHRMSVAHEPILGPDSLTPRNIIVPRKTALLARKLLGQGGNVTMVIGAKDVQFTFEDGTVLFGKSLDGTYPNWRGVLPVTTEVVKVGADRLTAALSMLSATIDDKEKQLTMKAKIELQFGKEQLVLHRGEAGRCEVDVASSTDAPLEMAFNIGFLIDAMQTIGAAAEEVSISYGASATAISMRPMDKEFPLVVVMPLRN